MGSNSASRQRPNNQGTATVGPLPNRRVSPPNSAVTAHCGTRLAACEGLGHNVPLDRRPGGVLLYRRLATFLWREMDLERLGRHPQVGRRNPPVEASVRALRWSQAQKGPEIHPASMRRRDGGECQASCWRAPRLMRGVGTGATVSCRRAT